MNPIGKATTWMMTNPLGEEITEGTVGGLLYGSGGLGTDQPIEETATKTLGAIAGGIALGMGGRRLGAMAGKAINPKALKDQEGFLATAGRLMGSETTAKGVSNQVTLGKAGIEKTLLEESSYKLLDEANTDPEGFFKRYGMDPQIFKSELDRVNEGIKLKAALSQMEAASPESRKVLTDAVLSNYKKAEDILRADAAGSINERLARLEKVDLDSVASELGVNKKEIEDAINDMKTNNVDAITGEHIGRGIGRMAGDEIGILLGAAGGGALYDSMQGE